MNIVEAKRIMEGVPRDQVGALDAALERYKRFSGIYTMDELAGELAADRATFPHLLKFDDGMPVLSCSGSHLKPFVLAFDAVFGSN